MSASLSPDEVRAARATLDLSASEAARLVGLSDGSVWRRWERDGVSGPGAVLIRALVESRAVRQHFHVSRRPRSQIGLQSPQQRR